MAFDPNDFKTAAPQPREDALVAELMHGLLERNFPEMESAVPTGQIKGRGGDDYQYGGAHFLDYRDLDMSYVTEIRMTFKPKEGQEMGADEDVLLQRKAELAQEAYAVFGYASQGSTRPLPEVTLGENGVTLKLNETARTIASRINYKEVEHLLPDIAESMSQGSGRMGGGG